MLLWKDYKIDKPLITLTKRKNKKTKINKTRDETGDIAKGYQWTPKC